MSDERPERGAFRVLKAWPTRWRDNDLFGHMNNVVYHEYFDSAVNHWLCSGALDGAPMGPVIGLVAETRCRHFAGVAYPEPVEVGLRVDRIGNSSVTYGLGLFGAEPLAAAVCRYVHVYVDARTRRPTPLPPDFRAALTRISA
jgi:acyl-CoA thioester hydrolase